MIIKFFFCVAVQSAKCYQDLSFYLFSDGQTEPVLAYPQLPR